MPFVPATITLHEAGPGAPYRWCMDEPLTWTDGERQIAVPAPFVTDLASVPRSLTWLFPRYGKYTKAAVVHDFLCQHFSHRAAGAFVVADRSDADSVFLTLMHELGVPWLRRHLMWGAVSWATMFSTVCLAPRRAGRLMAIVGLVVLVALLVIRHDLGAVVVTALVAPLVLIVAGVLALRRPDRITSYLGVYALTLVFAPLLALGLVLAIALFAYLLVEDAAGGFPEVRRLWANLTSPEAKLQQLGTPQFARIAAILQS